jgi:fumarate reductase subunit D
MEGECFGLPNGGMIAALVFGTIIILVGLGLFLQSSEIIPNFDFGNLFWPFIIIIFGILILAGAIYGRRRHT